MQRSERRERQEDDGWVVCKVRIGKGVSEVIVFLRFKLA